MMQRMQRAAVSGACERHVTGAGAFRIAAGILAALVILVSGPFGQVRAQMQDGWSLAGAGPAAGDGSRVRFTALLSRAGQQVGSGLVWRIYAVKPGPDGRYPLLATHRQAAPEVRLAPGEYLVIATLGRAYVARKISVRAGARRVKEQFVLNAGGLRLDAVLANGEPIPAKSVTYDIYTDERDQFAKRKKVFAGARSNVVIRLNSGIYHVVSTYGDANAVVAADVTVEAGKLTEAAVYHAAGRVTFKLVARPGGEALADTKWRILTPAGVVVKESAGALPTHILAVGAYRVQAYHGDGTFARTFSVGVGQAQEIEVVVGR